MKLTPLADRVLVELDTEADETTAGLHIPQTARHRPRWGTVAAVGPGRFTTRDRFVPTQLQPGDRACVPWAVGVELGIDGRQFVMIRESEIEAIEHEGN